MITNQHNDGGCFKLTVIYWDNQDHLGSEKKYIMYGEDEDELWAHFVEVRHLFLLVDRIEIRDDSK